MKKREEFELKFYEKLGVKEYIKISKYLECVYDRITLALTPDSKKAAKQKKIKERKNYYSSRKIEGAIKCRENTAYNLKDAFLLAGLYLFGTSIFVMLHAPIPLIAVCFSGTFLFGANIMPYRYATLKAKKLEEKWHYKYEGQKEDAIANIMTKSKELGRPRCEIITNNNYLEQTSFCKLTSNAELSELKKYDNYLDSYKQAYENSETLPTLEYDKAKNKTLRLVPSYTKSHK